ncbi:MAG: glycosyltransferase family 39 protein, partial [Nitrososphaerales archaeon]|nr:glycosyltransferase family 39 protein [Nitrososphaerales archaeon]
IGLFRLMNLFNIDRVNIALPFYIALWSFITIVSIWSLLKLLGFRPSTVAMTLIFFAITPTFLFLAAGFFTETVSLAFASLATYFLVRSLKRASIPSAFLSSVLFWVAMRSREPYSLLFLGAVLVVLSQIPANKGNRRKLAAVAVVFLLVSLVSVYGTGDVVSSEAIQSTQVAVQNFAVGPLLAILFPPIRQVSTTTSSGTSTASGATTGGSTVVTGTYAGTNGTRTTSGGSQTNVGTTATTTSQSISTETSATGNGGGGQPETQGILAILGITWVPDSGILRMALLMFVSFVTGYGPMVILLFAGGLYLLYDALVGRRLLEAIPMLLLVVLFLGTLGGVLLVFVYQPSYFGIQHYSTLLRFANTSVLMLPLLVAPFIENVASSKRVRTALVLVMLVLYVGFGTTLAQIATTNLDPSENPLTLTPPAGWHTADIALRDFILSHPQLSPYFVTGITWGTGTWTPGLSGRPDLVLSDYLNNSQLSRLNYSRLYVYVAAGYLGNLRDGYGITWQLARDGLAGNQSVVGGFRADKLIFNDSSGMLVEVSRV